MATNTYVALDTQTVTSAVSSVTFDSIDQGYTDLVLVCQMAMSSAGNEPYLQVGNGSASTTGYSETCLAGNAGTVSSRRGDISTAWQMNRFFGIGSSLNNIHIVNFQNYANTTTYKTVISRTGTTDVTYAQTQAIVGLWASTSAINTIKISTSGGNIVAGSTFTLYGIANSDIGAPKAFGGTITQDADYTYHTFGASGTFTPQQSLTADVLVVAGGGSGGGNQGGGGGAGGLLYQTGRSVSSGAYTVTIGAGGTANGITTGNSGTNSVFDTITALGGGGGGTTAVGVNGGSGGGGGYNGLAGGSSTQGNSGGATGYGNAGSAHDSANNLSGAGGGAGTAGNTSLNSTTSGAGGAGLDTWSSWLQTTGQGVNGYIAGGGGGGNYAPQGRFAGAGGIGGGGAGADTTPSTGTAGRTNTGSGGGGGAGANNAAGAGGSGVVIIRYAN